MIKGVNKAEEAVVLEILAPYFNKYNFFYYGSRVKGDFTALSDLDILVKGASPLDLDDLESLKAAFDKSNLPYVVNFADYYSLSGDFYKLIEPALVPIKP